MMTNLEQQHQVLDGVAPKFLEFVAALEKADIGIRGVAVRGIKGGDWFNLYGVKFEEEQPYFAPIGEYIL